MPKILLVEDNEINRDMLSRRLERKGYQVIVAVNGAEGVSKAQSEQPDLVLMDLHLPVLDGWQATRQLKADPQTQAIPVIALTADAITGEREKALAAGCDEYDTKPVDLPRLLEKIDQLLEPTAPPAAPETPSFPQNHRLQRILRTQLRRELDPPIYSIIGYSELLLEATSGQPDLTSDLQKIYTSALQLLRLIHAILNPVLVEIQQQEINLVAPTLRLELLTPLSTIVGYCEILLEEAPADLTLDLKQIYSSAQDLLSRVNNLDSLVKQHLQSIQSLHPDQLSAAEKPLEFAPVRAPQLDASETRRAASENRHILVIDNAANCTVLLRQLEHQGCQVTIATIHQQALQALASQTYDLVLLNVSLPEINGLRLLEQLMSDQERRQIPTLLMVAPDEMEAAVQGIALGATDYLIRPFQSVLLRTKIMACLERQRLQEQPGLSGLLQNLPVGAYRASAEGRFKEVNPFLVRLLGYPAAEALKTVASIAQKIYVDPTRYAEFKRLLEQDQVTGFEYQAYRYDGDLIWVSESAHAVRDSSGTLLYYEGILEEVTQRKLTEAALKQELAAAQRELEQVKYVQQAAEIVQTDYFQQLQQGTEAPSNLAAQLPADLPPKVLLVEDNELNCDMLSRRLRRSGYEVVIASDGADGLSKALSEQPQVILMDISLPVMDGWEATQQLKANPQTCRIPVIALTAHAMAGDRERALAAGCDDYDTKPIDLPRLLNKIEECLKCK